MKELNKERLGKIVELARRGAPGEREVAESMVRKICEKYELDFQEVMTGKNEQEFHVDFPKRHFKLALHIVIRYAFDGLVEDDAKIFPSVGRSRIYFTTTIEKFVEVEHALSVLLRLYLKEEGRVRQATYFGFLEKHDLYATQTGEGKKPHEITAEDMRIRRMGSNLAETMEDADIRKTLSSGRS